MEELLSDAVLQSSEFLLDSYAPSRTKCRVILLLIYIYIAGFDSISDLIAWGSFLQVGFGHPLLPTPLLWSAVWGLFSVAGLALALMSTSHEVMKLFHPKGSFCQSHVELMPLAGLLLEDLPMLVMASLYGLSQYTCSTGSIIASSDALVPILISSVGTALATFWRLMLTVLRLREQRERRRGRSDATNPPKTQKNVINSSNHSKIEEKTGKVSTSEIGNVSRSGCSDGGNVVNIDSAPSGCGLGCWLHTFYKSFIFLFGLAICLLSVLVVTAVSYLMVQQNPPFVHRPRDPLLIFAPSSSTPWPHPLANLSTVIDNDRVTLAYEERCLLVLQYRAEQHRIAYNFAAGVEGSGGWGERDWGERGVWCKERLSDLFYGSYRDREAPPGHVERFHRVCLAVRVVLPHITARPVWDPALEVV